MVAFPDLSREDENGAYTSSGVPKIVAPYLATTDEDLEKIKNMYDDAPPTPIHDSISSTRSSITFISVISIPDPTDIISTTSIQPRKEHWWNVMIEVALPFLLGGVGTIAAGIILGSVEKWPVFQHVRALFILVPALQGLKGNLDMCLASRLSTLANKGKMHTMKQIRTIVIGNIALVQSALVSFLRTCTGRATHPLYCLDRSTVHVLEAVRDELTSIHSTKENSCLYWLA
uniref:SLC41A/MgtE integral membrane domain-containing protein n=1 Tax=Timema tahoe TaxID=61484 RepID=A0A7R9INR6_9NEOP|nr:unnamed protein product [Timema tahoe]